MRIFQLILDEVNDADLIAWLDQHPRGRKNDAMRGALRNGIQQQGDSTVLQEILHEVKQLRRGVITTTSQPMTGPQTDEDTEIANNLDGLLGI